MALLIAFLLALATACTSDAQQSAHHHRTSRPPKPPPPPAPPVWPPPDPCYPYLDVCKNINCGLPDPDDDSQGFTTWDNCCRPVVPPVGPFLSSATVSKTSAAAPAAASMECGTTTGFPGLSPSSSSSAAAAAAAAGKGRSTAKSTTTTSASAAAARECVTPLARLSAACGAFLMKGDARTPLPQSNCCAKLATFVNGSSTAADDDGGRDTLRCISPAVLSHVNKLLHAPLDLARIMYLPVQCGVVFPPETLYVCLTGQRRPPLVSRIPEEWED